MTLTSPNEWRQCNKQIHRQTEWWILQLADTTGQEAACVKNLKEQIINNVVEQLVARQEFPCFSPLVFSPSKKANTLITS